MNVPARRLSLALVGLSTTPTHIIRKSKKFGGWIAEASALGVDSLTSSAVAAAARF